MPIELVADEKQKDKLERKKDRKGDIILQELVVKKPKQIDTYIDNAITDLDSAKALIKILTKAVVSILKERELE